MKMSEKFKIEEDGEIFRRRSHSYVEERFFLMTKILDFAAICNRKGFSEWTHLLANNFILLVKPVLLFFLLFGTQDIFTILKYISMEKQYANYSGSDGSICYIKNRFKKLESTASH